MYFPIGDIHGCYDLLMDIYGKILKELEDGLDPVYGGHIVFMGDYVDRGPDTHKVLDFLMHLKDVDDLDYPIKHTFLRGNHEQMMIDCRRDDDLYHRAVWLDNGGRETLAGFHTGYAEFVNGALDPYVEWMEQLPYIINDADYIFVHAGVDRGVSIANQNTYQMMWDCDDRLDYYKDMDRIVVHGHRFNKPGGPLVDMANKRVWADVGANLFGRMAVVCLPEPYDYGYETPESGYKIIETRPERERRETPRSDTLETAFHRQFTL